MMRIEASQLPKEPTFAYEAFQLYLGHLGDCELCAGDAGRTATHLGKDAVAWNSWSLVFRWAERARAAASETPPSVDVEKSRARWEAATERNREGEQRIADRINATTNKAITILDRKLRELEKGDIPIACMADVGRLAKVVEQVASLRMDIGRSADGRRSHESREAKLNPTLEGSRVKVNVYMPAKRKPGEPPQLEKQQA